MLADPLDTPPGASGRTTHGKQAEPAWGCLRGEGEMRSGIKIKASMEWKCPHCGLSAKGTLQMNGRLSGPQRSPGAGPRMVEAGPPAPQAGRRQPPRQAPSAEWTKVRSSGATPAGVPVESLPEAFAGRSAGRPLPGSGHDRERPGSMPRRRREGEMGKRSMTVRASAGMGPSEDRP